MANTVETATPANTPKPIGPYNHIAKVGQFISIGGTAGVNPVTGQLAGPDVYSQAKQILESFAVMLQSVGSDLTHVIHKGAALTRLCPTRLLANPGVDPSPVSAIVRHWWNWQLPVFRMT